MEALTKYVELIKALTPLVWPAIALIALFKLMPQIESILSKNEGKIEIGSFKLSYGEATEKLGTQIKDLQDKIISIEKSHAGSIVFETKSHNTDNKSKSILWVDDFPSNNAFLIDRFKKEGIEIQLSISTDDALKKIENQTFDLIITDLGRHENGNENRMAGLDLIASIRKIGKTTPVLVFAGQRGLENADKLKAAGANAVTNSPTDVVEYVDKIRRQER